MTAEWRSLLKNYTLLLAVLLIVVGGPAVVFWLLLTFDVDVFNNDIP